MTELPLHCACSCSEIMSRRRLEADAEGARLPENRKGETGDTESDAKNKVAWDLVQSFVKELLASKAIGVRGCPPLTWSASRRLGAG